MELSQLLSSIDMSKLRGVKEMTEAVENLKANSSDLEIFLINNNVIPSEFEIASYLVQQATALIDKRTPLSLVKNIYDQYSVIYAICALNAKASVGKSGENKLSKMFFDIISNSSKFDVYMKVVKNLKKVASSTDIVMEFYWLVPLFSNPKVLIDVDYSKFITEMKEVAMKVPDFLVGYEYYVTNDIVNMDKTAYKQYLTEGLTELAVTK